MEGYKCSQCSDISKRIASDFIISYMSAFCSIHSIQAGRKRTEKLTKSGNVSDMQFLSREHLVAERENQELKSTVET